MNIKIFCRCSLFPSWSGKGLISTPVVTMFLVDSVASITHDQCDNIKV
jgi:hypothetical protein